jgi:hypothetical protein
MKSLILVTALGSTAAAGGSIDVDAGLQATTTAWPDDHGGGATLSLGYWFLPWVGATYLGKEQYATVDDRVLSYFSVNAASRFPIGPLRATTTLGIVHQHEEPRAALMEQPGLSVVGTADGIRHRFAGRTGLSLAYPMYAYSRGDMYLSLDLDGTVFTDTNKGPRWNASAGMSFGFTFDFAKRTR